jgi:iron(III) transport system substrate-binding protein
MNKKALAAAAVFAGISVAAALAVLLKPGEDLVVYTSADSVYSRPVVEAFEKRTGLRVGLVPDAEAAKTTGLYHRLLAEQGRPRADVFWSSEIGRTVLLEKQGVLNGRSHRDFACRVHIIIYNKELVKPADVPRSVLDLADPKWKGKAAMAYPLFGTTATHAAALRLALGREKANDFFRKLVANGTQVVNGNGIVAERVAMGQAAVGFTDTDDYWGQADQGKPVGIVYPGQEEGGLGALVIPNTAAQVVRGPHPEAARLFLEFLASPEAERMLAAPPARHLPLNPAARAAPDAKPLSEIRAMKVDWVKVAAEIEAQGPELGKIFPR